MKLLPLTNGGVTKVSDVDYEILNLDRWYRSGAYIRRTTDKRYLHAIVNDTPAGYVTDHVNGDTLDNRRENLRTADKSMNSLNRGLNRNNTSGYRGVVFMPGRAKPWRARLKLHGHAYYFGYHTTAKEASTAFEEGYSKLIQKGGIYENVI